MPGSYSDNKRKRRVGTIAFASIVLVAMVVAVAAGFTAKANDHGSTNGGQAEISSSKKAVESICQPTDYKDACIESLEAAAGNSSDPRRLIQAAFEVAEKYINDAAKKSQTLQELEKDPRTSGALASCKELMEHALDDLKRSVDEVEGLSTHKFDEFLANLKTWISAVITDQETCLDGFEGANSDAGKQMQEALKYSMQLSSNALAIVTEISSTLNSLRINGLSRRLLQDGDDFAATKGWVENKLRILLGGVGPRKIVSMKADLVVAKDGSGNFRTINEALRAIPPSRNKTFVLHVKEGVYQEYVQFDKIMTDIILIGDGAEKTRITGNKNFIDGTPTYQTATVIIEGERFVAKNIGFENSAGPEKHQAVALRVQADMSIFYNCSIDGYQDTLYAHSKRQFFRDCTISGTIDFIFGDSAAVFQNCKFLVRKPLDNQRCIVTAQGRKDKRQATGIIIQNSTFTSAPEYYPVRHTLPAFLGRPWKDFSRTVIMESFLDDLIHPQGWLPWEGEVNLNTCWYAELNNYGPGASTAQRVAWRGIRTMTFTRQHALDFTTGNFIYGDHWIKFAGVPYTSGLVFNDTSSLPKPAENHPDPSALPESKSNAVPSVPVAVPAETPKASKTQGSVPVVAPVAAPKASKKQGSDPVAAPAATPKASKKQGSVSVAAPAATPETSKKQGRKLWSWLVFARK